MSNKGSPDLAPLEQRIGYKFADVALLRQALAHVSACTRRSIVTSGSNISATASSGSWWLNRSTTPFPRRPKASCRVGWRIWCGVRPAPRWPWTGASRRSSSLGDGEAHRAAPARRPFSATSANRSSARSFSMAAMRRPRASSVPASRLASRRRRRRRAIRRARLAGMGAGTGPADARLPARCPERSGPSAAFPDFGRRRRFRARRWRRLVEAECGTGGGGGFSLREKIGMAEKGAS